MATSADDRLPGLNEAWLTFIALEVVALERMTDTAPHRTGRPGSSPALTRLRPRVGDRRPRARRPRRRDGARHPHARRPRRRSTATRCCRSQLDVTDRDGRLRRRRSRRTSTSAASTSWSTTPATASSAWSRSSREQEVRDQIETNVFGALWVTQAALPFLREQGAGHIIQVSSIGGISAFPIRRRLPRVEVGARGLHARRWPRRSPGSASTSRSSSRRLLHRLGRLRRRSTPSRSRRTTSCTSRSPRQRGQGRRLAGRPDALGRGDPRGRRRRAAAAARASSARAARDRQGRLRVAAGDAGRSGSRSPSSRRAEARPGRHTTRLSGPPVRMTSRVDRPDAIRIGCRGDQFV